MNKKVLALLIAFFILGFYFCIRTGWDWALQMLLPFLIMVVIIAKNSKKISNSSVITNLAELATIFGISFSPNIMGNIKPYIIPIHVYIISYIRFDWLSIDILLSSIYYIIVAIFYLVMYLASKLFKDNTIMQKHHGAFQHILSNDDFLGRRSNFCNMLKSDIERIEIESQWNDYYFTPLEVEVIVDEFNKTYKKSSDIMKALKNKSYENAFLVLGDPGSGKSTALRKLAKELLGEVTKTNKIPLYINLKEWDVEDAFNEDNPPQKHHLIEFIKAYLINHLGDIFAPEFINDYFNVLYDQGCFYFILDSFDEIPMLLDESESSWLVDSVSALIYSLCSHNDNIKLILSSRPFRKPTTQFRANIKMHIKQFSDSSIRNCFMKYTNSSQLAVKLFTDHKELIPIAKNPFYASLISLYYKNTQQLPNKEVDLYDQFILTRLEQYERSYSGMSKNNINAQEVIYNAQIIAAAIFDNPKYGIDIPYNVLFNDYKISDYIIDILQKSKLIRIGGGFKRTISFTHRRFNEYFYASTLLDSNIDSYKESIPTDTKQRDTLVLYAQICPEDKANKLIEYCCSLFEKIDFIEDISEDTEISKYAGTNLPIILLRFFTLLINFVISKLKVGQTSENTPIKKRIIINSDLRNAINSLRFLTAAFTTHPAILLPYKQNIVNFTNILLQESNYYLNKLAVQAVPILSQDNITETLVTVLNKNNPLLDDEVIYYCTYLNDLNESLFHKLVMYYLFMNVIDVFSNTKMHLFNLSLFSNHKIIIRLFITRIINIIMAFILIPILLMLADLSGFSIYRYSPFFIVLLFSSCLLAWFEKKVDLYARNAAYILRVLFNPLVIVITGIIPQNIYLFLATLLFPSKTDIYYYYVKVKSLQLSFTIIKNHFIVFIKKSIEYIIGIIIYLVIACPISYMLVYITALIVGDEMLSVVILLFIILFVSPLISYVINLIKDKHFILTLNHLTIYERSDLSEILYNIKTTRYQFKFLLLLKEKDLHVTGDWKNNKYPILHHYKLESVLAQLEEKWSKL